MSCAETVVCDEAWAGLNGLICSGYLAGNLTEAFGKPIEMDPAANGCNITNSTKPALAPALAAQAATTSAVVTAVVAASVAGSVAGLTYT